tara:strand:- start:74 stop:796 length:723 start_codon:yes stop_codon:yes gene_type:complete
MILIPMMGKSSRFYNAGYKTHKFKLPVRESNLFIETVLSFKDYFDSDFFIFSIPNDQDLKIWIKEQLRQIQLHHYHIVTFDYDTNGQADTIFKTIQTVEMIEEELNIFNIDTILLNFNKVFEGSDKCDGYLEVFYGEGDHWSFAEVDNNNKVIKTAEKDRISSHCSNGFYNFKNKQIFVEGFLKQQEYNMLNNLGEIYIAPVYNFLINNGYQFKIKQVDINDIIFSGTPSEYKAMLKNYK